MKKPETIELKSLVGLHKLSGAEILSENIQHPYFEDEQYNGEVFLFVLDGKTYQAMEDSNDGYRSAMESIFITKRKVKNRFEPVKVFGILRDRASYGNSADVLVLYDVETTKVVLEVGTDNTDDYYPSFVCNFTPENMCLNQRIA